MSNEHNEQIKERCYEQAEWEVFSIKAGWFNNPEKFWEDMVEKKAKELYEKEEQTSFLYKKNWGMNDD